MVKPDLLFLAHRIPYPPNKGDKIRSWHIFKHLAEQWSVHLGCFIDDPEDRQYRDRLSEMAASSCFVEISPGIRKLKSAKGFLTRDALSVAYYQHQQMTEYVQSVHAAASPAVQVAFSSSMAPFFANTMRDVPTVVDFCDSDAEKWRAYSDEARFPMSILYKREARLLADLESYYANKVMTAFAITAQEAEIFNRRSECAKPVSILQNGVDTDYFSPLQSHHDCPHSSIVFSGAMDYKPNVDAVIWFTEYVWPLITSTQPEATFSIVGSNPVPAVKDLAQDSSITVTGRVADMRPWLGGAQICVAPLQIARGIQNKILEAMAMARPVVATRAAAEGIEAEEGKHFMRADDPEAMAEAIVMLLADPVKRQHFGQAGRALVEARYGWQAKLTVLDEALAGI